MYNYILAMVLISSPEYTSHVSFAEDNWILADPIAKIAIDWELLDPRERRYVFARPEDFVNDLVLVQNRYQKLCNAPFAIDSKRFPPRDFANEAKSFNREYKKQIELRLQIAAIQNREYWREVIKETDYLYKIWDLVRDGDCEYYYITVRREALKNLREEIGDDAYYNGELPPYIPIWRFEKLK